MPGCEVSPMRWAKNGHLPSKRAHAISQYGRPSLPSCSSAPEEQGEAPEL